MQNLSSFFLLAWLMSEVFSPVAPAHAQDSSASMNVTPLRLEVPSGEASTQMLIRNRAKNELDLQLRVFEWNQIDGQDRYIPSQDVAVSPSIVSITPGEAQAFHIIAEGKRGTLKEKRYRVVIDELPRDYRATPGVAQTTLRLTVPLFVDRDHSAMGTLKVIERLGSIQLQNVGEQTVRLANIYLKAGRRNIDIPSNESMHYIHGGSWVTITLPDEQTCQSDPIRVAGLADLEAYDATAEQVCI